MINIDYFKQKEQAASQKLVYTTSGLLAILNTVVRLFLMLFFVKRLNSYLLSPESSCLLFPSIIGLLLNLKLLYIFFWILSSTCFSVVFAQFLSC